jgi:small subunit ribosomal protein S17
MSFERKKARVGRVVSDKMDKTVVVRVEHRRAHRLYKKSIQLQKRYVAHDPENDARLGDLVRLIESRPISKTKRWRVASIIERGNLAEIQPGEIATEAGAEPGRARQVEAEPRAEDPQPEAVAVAEPETVPEDAFEQPEEPDTAPGPEAIQEAEQMEPEQAEPEPLAEQATAKAESDEPDPPAEQALAEPESDEPEAAPEAALETEDGGAEKTEPAEQPAAEDEAEPAVAQAEPAPEAEVQKGEEPGPETDAGERQA